jgi:iron complex transport system substrate-binding protein
MNNIDKLTFLYNTEQNQIKHNKELDMQKKLKYTPPNMVRVLRRGLLILALIFSNCSPKQAPKPPPQAPETVLFTDSVGRQVELPAKINSVIPSGALSQMFLIAIAPDLLCAATGDYTPEQAEFIPQEVLHLPIVGQYYGARNLNLEVLASIAPDVFIDIGDPTKTIAEDMEGISQASAVPAVHITATLDETPEAFRMLGRLLGREERGEALASFCEKTLASAQDIMARASKKPVLYCMGKGGLNVLASGSFHAEVMAMMTENRAVVDNPSSRGSGNETDLEQILLWDPDLILFAPDSIYSSAGSDPTWRQLRAIRDGAYYEVPAHPFNWMGSPPSINRYQGILWLGSILYPEYAHYDLYTEMAEYYRLFYWYSLSRERFDELTAGSLKKGA